MAKIIIKMIILKLSQSPSRYSGSGDERRGGNGGKLPHDWKRGLEGADDDFELMKFWIILINIIITFILMIIR